MVKRYKGDLVADQSFRVQGLDNNRTVVLNEEGGGKSFSPWKGKIWEVRKEVV